MIVRAALAALCLLAVAAPLAAHHGTAGSYDHAKVIKLTGIANEFRWRNPHSALFLTVRDGAGNSLTYALEMGSPNTLARMGLRRDMIKPGDEVQVEFHPSFTGPTNGVALSRQIVVNGAPLLSAGKAAP